MKQDLSITAITAGDPTVLGAFCDGEGTNFALFSEHATKVELCLFSPDGSTERERLPLPDKTGAIWNGYVPGLKEGALYGYRVTGPSAPSQGHRFNPAKLVADPYARVFHGDWRPAPETLDRLGTAKEPDYSAMDSASAVPKCVVTGPDAPWDRTPHPRRSWSETVIYEAHVKGLTQLHPDIPKALRGTYEALGSDVIVKYLQELGITALELMPVHAFMDDGFLVDRGLRNYWGYNSLNFFALESRYLGPNGIEGFKQAVDKLHQAGIEVLLDVVFNHTAEGDHRGPTLSFRGIDNASYYHLEANHAKYYVNDTGCGNTLAVHRPHVLRLVLDSLRYWVSVMGVDGFRFDLATTLGREPHGFDLYGGFFNAIRQDPRPVPVQVDCRTLGYRAWRLSAWRVPTRLGRMERPISRLDETLLARG